MTSLCKQSYEEVKELLKAREKEVRKVAAMLIEKETLELDDLTKILGRRNNPQYDKLMECAEDRQKSKNTTTVNVPPPSITLNPQ